MMAATDSNDDSVLEHSMDVNSDLDGSTTNELEEELPKMALEASSQSSLPSLVLPPAAGIPTTSYDSSGTFSTTSCDPKTAWYNDPKYSKYWSHWRQMNTWFKKHSELYSAHCRKQWEDTYGHWYKMYQMYLVNYQQFYGHQSPYPSRRGSSRTRKPREKRSVSSSHLGRRKKRTKRKSVGRDKSSAGHSSATDLECQMEVSEGLMEFMMQSAQFRKERDSLRKTEEDQKTEYINAAEVSSAKHRATTEAPKVQAGSERTKEMRFLYGQGAAMIHGMETAMQLQFDRRCDQMKSKLWPVIPLNMKFNS